MGVVRSGFDLRLEPGGWVVRATPVGGRGGRYAASLEYLRAVSAHGDRLAIVGVPLDGHPPGVAVGRTTVEVLLGCEGDERAARMAGEFGFAAACPRAADLPGGDPLRYYGWASLPVFVAAMLAWRLRDGGPRRFGASDRFVYEPLPDLSAMSSARWVDYGAVREAWVADDCVDAIEQYGRPLSGSSFGVTTGERRDHG